MAFESGTFSDRESERDRRLGDARPDIGTDLYICVPPAILYNLLRYLRTALTSPINYMKLRQLLLAGMLVCLAVSGAALAQVKGSGPDKTNIDEKQIFVRSNLLVVDETGEMVTVGAGDVKIFEDGAEQKLSYFNVKDPHANLGLVVDNTGSMRKNLDEVLKIRSTIAEILVPRNDVFVIRFVDSDKVELIQDWTSDRTAVSGAIDQMFVEGGRSAVLDWSIYRQRNWRHVSEAPDPSETQLF